MKDAHFSFFKVANMKVTRKSKNSANSQENDIDPANLRNLRSRTNQNLDHPKTPVKDGDRKNEDFDEGSMFYKISFLSNAKYE